MLTGRVSGMERRKDMAGFGKNTGFGSVSDCQQENTMGAEREGH